MHKMRPCIVHSIVLALLSFKKLKVLVCVKNLFLARLQELWFCFLQEMPDKKDKIASV